MTTQIIRKPAREMKMKSSSVGLSDKAAPIDRYCRAANYPSVGRTYLLDNPLLREPLAAEHVKPKLLGHWGTSPGPQLVHRLIYKRASHANIHVHGFNEEGTTTTPFDMAVLNCLDRFHLALDEIDRITGLAEREAHSSQDFRDQPDKHQAFIAANGEDMPEVLNWKWPYSAATGIS